MPSLNEMLVMELARCDYITARENILSLCVLWESAGFDDLRETFPASMVQEWQHTIYRAISYAGHQAP